MTPDRWRDIERLYHAALEREAIDRAGFLARACAGDDAMRREVESLIAHATAGPNILDAPAGGPLRAVITARLPDALSAPGRHVGSIFGAYALQTLVATGGMGEVYRAVDTRLHRTVAIKILSQHLSRDPERQQQFRREAQIISGLNHPHICTIYDVGIHGDLDFIVMEYIEGETLQQRLARGALPLARAVEYATQIVDALDKAHRRGIVHRDLKPGNVMITAAGVKLLDFGIATHIAAEGPPLAETVMATLPYASPEQLDGRPVDARTDLFSFGVTAYEMIVGRPAFQGDTPAGLIDSSLRDEPVPIRDLAPAVPAALARTLSRCLAKDPDDRWQTANDLLFGLRSLSQSPHPETSPSIRRAWLPVWAERMIWAAAVLAASSATFLFIAPRADRLRERAGITETAETPDISFDLWPERGTEFVSGFDVPFALAPDGRSLVYVAFGRDGIKRLWVRRFDGTGGAAREIAGTDGANTPFWSPDGEWVGFFTRQGLMKVRVSSGRVHVIAARATTMAGATWNADGVILFSTGPGGLSRVAADGGAISAATREDGSHFWPQFMADGQHFLYAAALTREIRVGSLDGGPSRVLMKVPVRISSLGYVRGYLFFGTDATLFARRLDETTLTLSGEAAPILRDIPITQLGRMPFSVSPGGTLAFWPYPGGTPATLRWLGDGGHVALASDTPARYVGVSLDADGRRVAFSRRNADGGADVWIRDRDAARDTQLTFDGFSFAPRWSPDGGWIAFTSNAKQPLPRLVVRSLGQPAATPPVGASPLPTFPSGWCHDDQSIVTVRIDPVTRDDLYVERVGSGAAAERLPINTAGNDYQAAVSPDDRWIAYVTDDSGRDEVWVASFPSGRIRRQVSTDGGISPQWTNDGREIAFVSAGKWLTVRSFASTDRDVALGSPRDLIDASAFVETTPLLTPSANAYAAARHGRRFLAAVRASDEHVPPIHVIANWRVRLRR